MNLDYEWFKKKILEYVGINLSYYKEKQMKRRIESLMKKNGFQNYADYYSALTKDQRLFNEFINYLTINVSEFYRNPQQWEILEREIMPYILKRAKDQEFGQLPVQRVKSHIQLSCF